MAHNDFVREDGQWPPETVPTARDWALFDRAQSKGLTLAGGNAWAPSTPIIVGGAGMVLASGCSVRGGIRTESGGRIVLGDSDHVLVTPNRARVVVVPLTDAPRSTLAARTWELVGEPAGVRVTTVSSAILSFALPSWAMHNGAALATAILRFRVGQFHPQLPAVAASFGLRRLPIGRISSANLSSAAIATVSPAPATPDAYFASTAVQSMTLNCDQNNVIDTSLYAYVADVTDERGSNALPGNIFHSLELHFSTIPDLRPE
jgi:hypothetical protein